MDSISFGLIYEYFGRVQLGLDVLAPIVAIGIFVRWLYESRSARRVAFNDSLTSVLWQELFSLQMRLINGGFGAVVPACYSIQSKMMVALDGFERMAEGDPEEVSQELRSDGRGVSFQDFKELRKDFIDLQISIRNMSYLESVLISSIVRIGNLLRANNTQIVVPDISNQLASMQKLILRATKACLTVDDESDSTAISSALVLINLALNDVVKNSRQINESISNLLVSLIESRSISRGK